MKNQISDVPLNVHLPKEKVSIIGEYSKLKQVLINLLSNSIKYTAEGVINLCVYYEDDNRGYWYWYPRQRTGKSF